MGWLTIYATRKESKCWATVKLQTVARSQAPALAVIHKCKMPVIPAWTAGIQSQGCETAGWHIA